MKDELTYALTGHKGGFCSVCMLIMQHHFRSFTSDCKQVCPIGRKQYKPWLLAPITFKDPFMRP